MKAVIENQQSLQNLNIKIDPVVKSSAEGVLSGMGLSLSSYVGMCLRQLAQDRKVPFVQTVDAEFWMVESNVSLAKSFVDCGAFQQSRDILMAISEDFASCEDDLNAFVFDMTANEFFQLDKKGDWDYRNGLQKKLYLFCNLLSSNSSMSAFEDFADAFETISSLKRCLEKIEGVGDFFHIPIERVVELEERAQKLVELAFSKDKPMNCVIDGDSVPLDLDSMIKALNYVYGFTLDVTEKNETNMAMRFFSSVGQQSVFHEVVAAVKMREELRRKRKESHNSANRSESNGFVGKSREQSSNEDPIDKALDAATSLTGIDYRERLASAREHAVEKAAMGELHLEMLEDNIRETKAELERLYEIGDGLASVIKDSPEMKAVQDILDGVAISNDLD